MLTQNAASQPLEWVQRSPVDTYDNNVVRGLCVEIRILDLLIDHRAHFQKSEGPVVKITF